MRKIRGRRGILEVDAVDAVFSQTPYKVRSAKMRKCENGQRIRCEIESAKWRCENMYKMRKCEKEFDLHFDHSIYNVSTPVGSLNQ